MGKQRKNRRNKVSEVVKGKKDEQLQPAKNKVIDIAKLMCWGIGCLLGILCLWVCREEKMTLTIALTIAALIVAILSGIFTIKEKKADKENRVRMCTLLVVLSFGVTLFVVGFLKELLFTNDDEAAKKIEIVEEDIYETEEYIETNTESIY